jgi:hypothetical protein
MKRLLILSAMFLIAASCSAPVSQTPGQCARLIFKTTGDNGLSGCATAYDLRYSYDTITTESFATATRLTVVKKPKCGGFVDTLIITDLPSDTLIYFAMKVGDDAGNWSPVSNVPSFRTKDITFPLPITDLRAEPCP